MSTQLHLGTVFGNFISQISSTIAHSTLCNMKPYVLDTSAVMMAGSTAESSKIMVRAIKALTNAHTSVVAGGGKITDPSHSALLNGAYAHALELDDDHAVAVLHPGAVVVPSALSASTISGCNGREFLTAVVAGYEIMCRLGMAYRGSHFNHGFHPTAIFGVFGAVAAACVALKLNAEQASNAIGIAGTQASGLTEWRSDGSWIKRLHPGRAAQSGLLSACLAKAGFTGPASILEGAGGFFKTMGHGRDIDIEAITDKLGVYFHGLDTAIKPYPCCRFMHGAIDLAIEVFRRGIQVDTLERIQIRIYETHVLTYHQVPRNAVDAQFNVPYGVACALLQGALNLSDYEETSLTRPSTLDLCQKIQVSACPEYTQAYPDQYHVDMTLVLTDGSSMVLHSHCPSGDPRGQAYQQDPGLFLREAQDKAARVLKECGFVDPIPDRLIGVVDSLDDADSINDLLESLS